MVGCLGDGEHGGTLGPRVVVESYIWIYRPSETERDTELGVGF